MPIATPKPSSTPVAEGPSGPLVPFPRGKEYVDSNRGSEQYSAGPNQQGMPGHLSNQQNREGDHDQEDEDLTQAENAARTGHSMPEAPRPQSSLRSTMRSARRTASRVIVPRTLRTQTGTVRGAWAAHVGCSSGGNSDW